MVFGLKVRALRSSVYMAGSSSSVDQSTIGSAQRPSSWKDGRISSSEISSHRRAPQRRLWKVKGSMELLADRDPEEARKILDPVLTLMNRRGSV